MKLPLVSFCVSFFNQRKYVADALAGAFAQTYRPLEVVIGDDCSTDGTADEVERVISEYRAAGGDLKITFRRGEKNLGIMRHWMELVKLGRGMIIVNADGDDISLPERSQKIVEAWIKDGRRATVIMHDAVTIDADGRGEGLVGWNQFSPLRVLGSAMAYLREPILSFGAEVDAETFQDVVFEGRAMLIGPPLRMPGAPLVKYRQVGVTSASVAPTEFKRQRSLTAYRNIVGAKQFFKGAQSVSDSERKTEVCRLYLHFYRRFSVVYEACNVRWWMMPWGMAKYLVVRKDEGMLLNIRAVLRLMLPDSFYAVKAKMLGCCR